MYFFYKFIRVNILRVPICTKFRCLNWCVRIVCCGANTTMRVFIFEEHWCERENNDAQTKEGLEKWSWSSAALCVQIVQTPGTIISIVSSPIWRFSHLKRILYIYPLSLSSPLIFFKLNSASESLKDTINQDKLEENQKLSDQISFLVWNYFQILLASHT